MDLAKVKEVTYNEVRNRLIAGLTEPFDPAALYWKPQATNQAKTSAIAAAYADPREYSDRLNEVMGPDKWSCRYNVTIINPIGPNPAEPIKENEWKVKLSYKGKVLVVAELTLFFPDGGTATQCGTGEQWADDENAITAAEAQAFKRAAYKFGLGRYLYDLPKNQWCDYDKQTKKITKPPILPDWAIPKKHCVECNGVITPYEHNGNTYTISDLIASGMRKYKLQLCADCQKKRAEKK